LEVQHFWSFFLLGSTPVSEFRPRGRLVLNSFENNGRNLI